MKRSLLFVVLLLPAALWCQGVSRYKENYGDIAYMQQLSSKQLLDTAESYYAKGRIDTALVYYHMIISSPIDESDPMQYKIVIDTHNKAAVAYYYMGDYRRAYELLINALSLSEKFHFEDYQPLILTNIGNIYHRFNEFDKAKSYHLRALSLNHDSTKVALYNNLGELENISGNVDSAFYYLNEALRLSGLYNDIYKYNILNSLASLYRKERQYDSALYYYRSAAAEAKRQNSPEIEAENLSNLGSFWLELHEPDSARFHIELSNAIAVGNNFLPTVTENYLILSKIERSKGNSSDRVLEYFEKYAALKDSMLNAKNFGDINQLQRLYEVSKINRQIEELTIEQQFKEQTIFYHRIIQAISLPVLMVVSIVLLIVFRQKRKLNAAYKTLFEKNVEIIDFHGSHGKQPEKQKRPSPQDQDTQDDLLNRILAAMEETEVICDPKFSINMLAGLVQANHQYVSQVINTTFGKNFRTFLNSYRIREAQRLFAEPDSAKYTIESVSLSVGFRSRSTFREAFKEVTGISPTFYLNSMNESRQPRSEIEKE